MNACNFWSCAAMRASSASTIVTGDSRRAAISVASRLAGRKLGSVLATGMAISIRRAIGAENISPAPPSPPAIGLPSNDQPAGLCLQIGDPHNCHRTAVVEGLLFCAGVAGPDVVRLGHPALGFLLDAHLALQDVAHHRVHHRWCGGFR